MITIYTSPTCSRCNVLIQKLSKKEIPFVETHNIEEIEKLGFLQLPVIKYNEEYYSFNDFNNMLNAGEVK